MGGQWGLVDPTDGIGSDHVVVIARGRNATTTALTMILGKVQVGPVKIGCAVA